MFQVNPLLFCFSDKSPLINCASFVLLVLLFPPLLLYHYSPRLLLHSCWTSVKQQQILTLQRATMSPCVTSSEIAIYPTALFSPKSKPKAAKASCSWSLPICTTSKVTIRLLFHTEDSPVAPTTARNQNANPVPVMLFSWQVNN